MGIWQGYVVSALRFANNREIWTTRHSCPRSIFYKKMIFVCLYEQGSLFSHPSSAVALLRRMDRPTPVLRSSLLRRVDRRTLTFLARRSSILPCDCPQGKGLCMSSAPEIYRRETGGSMISIFWRKFKTALLKASLCSMLDRCAADFRMTSSDPLIFS
jgi:hypothetical protein